jgi:hypothetical protein
MKSKAIGDDGDCYQKENFEKVKIEIFETPLCWNQ